MLIGKKGVRWYYFFLFRGESTSMVKNYHSTTHIFLTDSVILTAVLFNGRHYKYLLLCDTLRTRSFHTKYTDINLSRNYGIRKKTYGKVENGFTMLEIDPLYLSVALGSGGRLTIWSSIRLSFICYV
jgi:hypothetical protein